MAVEAVLFDIDGTLVNSNDLHVRAWEQAFREAGRRIEPQAIHHQIGKGADKLVPALIPGATDEQAEALGDRHGAIFKERYLEQVRPFPGARDLLVRADGAGLKVVLASSASKAELDHYLGLLDARELVAAGTSIDDVGNSKPAPDIFTVAMRKIAPIRAEQAVVVGDSPYDVEGAAKCGIAAIGLRSGGFSDETLTGAGAVALYDDVAALLAGYEESVLAGVIEFGRG